MRNIDYICTLDVEDFHIFLCSLLGMSQNSMWGQILKSWLQNEVDDEFFDNNTEKQKYVDAFNSIVQKPQKISNEDLSSMFEAICKYFEQKGNNTGI